MIHYTIENQDGQVRWEINVVLNITTGKWEVHEDTDVSLFNQPMAVGDTADEAYINFLAIEQNLLDSL